MMAVFVVTFFRRVNQLNVPLLRSTLFQSGDASPVGRYGGRGGFRLSEGVDNSMIGSDGSSSGGAVLRISSVRGMGV